MLNTKFLRIDIETCESGQWIVCKLAVVTAESKCNRCRVSNANTWEEELI